MSVYDSIRNAIPPIHPEGHKFIAIFLVATLILGWLFEPLFWIGLALTIWCALFFRDPVRVTPVSNSLVVSPADGRVVYAGPFRSYGQLLILDAGDDYHIVLAGMERIDVQPDQFVLTGEPVGVMGSQRLASAAALDASVTQPVLYVEFRKGGTSIDPSPWWVASQDRKVSG